MGKIGSTPVGLKTEPREASFPWLRRCYGSRLQLHVQLQTWSTSNFHPLAGLRLELALEPAVEPSERAPFSTRLVQALRRRPSLGSRHAALSVRAAIKATNQCYAAGAFYVGYFAANFC